MTAPHDRPDRSSTERSEDIAALEQELARVVAEAEARLAEVRRELAERRLQEAQHAEIDRLEEHLANATVRWREVGEFFEDALQQLRSGRPDGEPSMGAAPASDDLGPSPAEDSPA
ncbi:hypothetical protein [Isoptericola haloaureus]|uniref:Uncharacterized protein n=1 Tax=Isoptericola haloaureus TaxID=1542902 RepID=A0ABU7Z8S2_9MICO